MGIGMSLLGKGLPTTQFLNSAVSKYYEQYIGQGIKEYENFHIAIIQLFTSLNAALPGMHFEVPDKDEVQKCFEEWKKETDDKKKKVFNDLIAKKVNTTRIDKTTMAVGLVAPPVAMALKRGGENVPKLNKINVIPDVVFVPTLTLVALSSLKFVRKLSQRKPVPTSSTQSNNEKQTSKAGGAPLSSTQSNNKGKTSKAGQVSSSSANEGQTGNANSIPVPAASIT